MVAWIPINIIHGLILCLLPTLKRGQNLFGILVSNLQVNIFIIVFYIFIPNTLK